MMSYLAKMRCNACKAWWFVTWEMAGSKLVGSGEKSCPDCGSVDLSNVCDRSTPGNGGLGNGLAKPLEIRCKLLTPTAKAPTKAYPGDLGWDLYADAGPNAAPWVILPHETRKIPTGLAFELPAGWGALVRPRSSQGALSVHTFGGVMDNSYRGEWGVLVHNANHNQTKVYNPGDKIGQFILIPSPESTVVQTVSLSETDRGDKSYGSSGRR